MTDLDSRRAAYRALDTAIEMLTDGASPAGHIVTDAVLVVGCQSINSHGQRVGSIGVFMKDGCQPVWITRALLAEGLDILDGEQHCSECCTCGE